MNPQLIFKCKCGTFQAELKGKPRTDFNCHCHSCVASAEFVESKSSWNGFSALSDQGGFSTSLMSGGNIDFVTDVVSEDSRKNIDFVKVGENGKMARAYCKGCGTMLGGFKSNFAFLNRNAIFHRDGTPYVPPGPVLNIMKKHAFDPAKVQEPSVSTFPFLDMHRFVPLLLGFGGRVAPEGSALYAGSDMSKFEAVPITWE